jgi:uncharacterized protein YbaR (Trm112 family)
LADELARPAHRPAIAGPPDAQALKNPYNGRPHWYLETVMIDKKLLSILVCPVSKAPLVYDKEKDELICKASGLAYPVKDGIPVMLESEARQLTADEKLG